MSDRPVVAWIVLAVFAAGGAVAPTVHRAHHAMERAAALDAHADAAHHHHEARDGHQAELQPACPSPLAVDWTCTLCGGLSASILGTEGAGPASAEADLQRRPVVRASESEARLSWDRGPPPSTADARAWPFG